MGLTRVFVKILTSFVFFLALFVIFNLFSNSKVFAQTCGGTPRGCKTNITSIQCVDQANGQRTSGSCSGITSCNSSFDCASGYTVGRCECVPQCVETFYKSCTVHTGGSCSAGGCGLGSCGQSTSPNCSWSSNPSPSPSGGGGGGGGNPTCSISLSPTTTNVAIGNTATFTVSVDSQSGGNVDQVDFLSSDTGIATVSPSSDTTAVFSTVGSGVAVGSATIEADALISGTVRCNAQSTINVTNPGPWWQVVDSDVMTNGNLTSTIPDSSLNFDVIGPGGYPGIPVYGGTLDLGSGTVSTTNWKANTTSNDPKTYNYAFFEKQVPSDVTMTNLTNASEPGTTFTTGGTLSRGYYWYKFDGSSVPGGSLTISSAIDIPSDRKVILLVDGADLNIQGNITIASKGNGFFMAVVGTNAAVGGNINVDSAVTRIEGLYEADGTFSTGASSSQFTLYGSVAAGAVNMERDLSSSNQTTPAEVFNYAPELLMLYPNKLSLTRYKWEEVAP